MKKKVIGFILGILIIVAGILIVIKSVNKVDIIRWKIGVNISDGEIADESGIPLIPKCENAYYFFKDRNHIGSDSESSDLLYQGAFNITVAVYDMDTSILYYCEYDS